MLNKIKRINIELTNKCNLRCTMCDIWKEGPKSDISPEIMTKIFESKYLDNNVDITFTGGELFLNEKLIDLTEILLEKRSNSLKTISTNGYFTKMIDDYLKKFSISLPEDFSLHISLDGINIHDQQRGKKSLHNILETINLVKEKYPRISIKIKFTITPLNYKDIMPTYEFCKKNNLDFRVKLVEYAENYTNKVDKKTFDFGENTKKLIAKDLLQIYKEKLTTDKQNAQFIKNTIYFLLNKSNSLSHEEEYDRIFIMSNGDVYSCIHIEKIGNLHINSLDEIWNSERAKSIISLANKCNKCLVSYHGLV